MIYHPVLVVGGGLAGMRAAIEASKTAGVAIISRVHPVRSHSGAAQGGINAALGNTEVGADDSWEKHAFDTVKGSDYLGDQEAIEIMAKEAPSSIFELEHWGAPFSRIEDGRIAQRPFGGAGFPRTCYAADKTGHVLLHTLYEQVMKLKIPVYYEWQVISLVVEEGVCRGVIALNLDRGILEAFQAEAVVFATGGSGRIYKKTTNAIINTGSGMAIAFHAGVPLKDMEFVQFHPTSLYGTNILISEAARGEGGYLLNKKGERFMRDYAPAIMELAPRDIVARSIQIEIEQGRGFEDAYVLLDLRHLGREKIEERLPGIRDISISFAGVDPIEQPIPIQPGQHYTMGGIDANAHGETEVGGFYAAGECACVSVHGANRLGGNSLLETIVFGRRVGDRAAKLAAWKGGTRGGGAALQRALEDAQKRVDSLLAGGGREDFSMIREEMEEVMIDKVGIFRERGPMVEALEKIKELEVRCNSGHLRYQGRRYNLDLARNVELAGMLDVAEVVVAGAILREESRGSHYRLDFRERDDERHLKHTLARYTPDGPHMDYKDVVITKFPPELRKY